MKTRSIAAAVVAILAVVAIVLTILGYYGTQHRGPVPATTATSSAPPIPVQSGSTQAYYEQTITWGACASGTFGSFQGVDSSDSSEYQCAFLKAPLDWAQPDGNQISLALAVHRSGSKNAPALFINPGGPGGAVVSALPYYAGQGLGESVVNAYDIIALDPRGVGDSTPVFCLSDDEKDKRNAGEDDATDTGDESPQSAIEAAQEDSRTLAAGCKERSGSLFEHIDTVSAARDFDMVRAVLGQDTLNLLGYSYGTFLGATYAGLFPERVGRFVLDGALDPSLSVNEVAALQMRGLDASLQQWISDCATQASCPMGRSRDEGIETVRSFLDSLQDKPLRTSNPNRPLTENLAMTAMTGAMYNTQWWPQLTQARHRRHAQLAQRRRHLRGQLFRRDQCDQQPRLRARGKQRAVGRRGGLPQEGPADPRQVRGLPVGGPRSVAHAPRPALAHHRAGGGVLVSVEGWNHTAYRRGANPCVVRAVEDYLVKGTVPSDGLMCQ